MFLRLLILLIFITTPAWADTPKAIEDYFKKEYPKAQIRLDGLLQVGDKLWLPFVNGYAGTEAVNLVLKTQESDYLFSNGWIYVPIKNNTVKGFDYYDEKIQAQILLDQITPGFLVPKGFTLPRDLAITAGRLPIELRTVELASDREIKFKERLKQEQISKPLTILSYSVKSGMLNKVELIKSDVNGNTTITKLEDLSDKFSYLSNIKRIRSKIYFVDYTKGKVYQLNETKVEFDATKPTKESSKAKELDTYNIEELLSISHYDMKTGLQDFSISDDGRVAYLLTNVDPKVLIVDLATKKLIKAVTVSPGGSALTMVSRNSSEPTQLYMISKSDSKLTTINSFDYRISSEVDLNKLITQGLTLNSDERFIPHSLAVNANYVFVGVEAVNKKSSKTEGRILVLDGISSNLVSNIKLDYIPYKLSLAADPNTLYALGSNDTTAYISKINIESMELISTTDLSPDIQSPKDFAVSQSGYFLLIPSAGTNIIGVLDIASWELVYKIDIGDSSNMLISL